MLPLPSLPLLFCWKIGAKFGFLGAIYMHAQLQYYKVSRGRIASQSDFEQVVLITVISCGKLL